jgi:5-methylcytosine-specific restriction endonuclease McrA
LRRHHGKCAVPGCTNRSYLHVHHTTPRSEGGTHDPDALIVLCDGMRSGGFARVPRRSLSL